MTFFTDYVVWLFLFIYFFTFDREEFLISFFNVLSLYMSVLLNVLAAITPPFRNHVMVSHCSSHEISKDDLFFSGSDLPIREYMYITIALLTIFLIQIIRKRFNDTTDRMALLINTKNFLIGKFGIILFISIFMSTFFVVLNYWMSGRNHSQDDSDLLTIKIQFARVNVINFFIFIVYYNSQGLRTYSENIVNPIITRVKQVLNC